MEAHLTRLLSSTQFRVLLSGMLSLLSVPSALAAANLALPAPSVWKMNPSASTSGDKSAVSPEITITVKSYSPGAMNVTVHYVGGDGRPLDITFNGAPDGRPHRYAGGTGSFRGDGVYTFEQADGTREYGTLSLSADGRTLTNTYTVKPRVGNGFVQVVSVYNRVK